MEDIAPADACFIWIGDRHACLYDQTTYRVGHYRTATYSASNLEHACRNALADEDWSCELRDFENPGQILVTAVWEGEDTAYSGPQLAVPEAFRETDKRKAELFDELVGLLREAALPMGLSRVEFERWQPRAASLLARSEAIAGDPSSSPV